MRHKAIIAVNAQILASTPFAVLSVRLLKGQFRLLAVHLLLCAHFLIAELCAV